jgi:retron-type reverse transcriptase
VHRVIGIFRQLGYSPAAATVLALLCTESPRRTVEYAGKPYYVATGPRCLPQGACTSPALSNLAARRMDSRLGGLAQKVGWTYTRYADDLSFSADGEVAQKIGYLLARIRHIAQDEGFAVNESKTRMLRQSARQLVTGIVVNDRPGISRKTVRRLRAILHRAKTEGLAAQNRHGHPNFDGWVRGMIAYISMVNPQQAKPLAEAMAALDGQK